MPLWLARSAFEKGVIMANYHDELKKMYTIKLREYIDCLPAFCAEFFRGISDNTAIRTRMGYAFDLNLFFLFLSENRANFLGIAAKDFNLDKLKQVSAEDIEAFMDYLSLYIKYDGKNERERQNANDGKSRKLAAVRTLFAYFYKKRRIDNNPAALVDFPKRFEKNIVRLEVDEVAKLLDEVESGNKLTETQQKYHKYTMKRDLAIVTLLLGTGIRLSECVGIDISHLNFDVNGMRILRKGGDAVVVYFGDEVADALLLYLDERQNMQTQPGHEDALFLSLQKRRISDKAVQNLVKKYAGLMTNLKNISPHKLRSTFGTNLYHETGDIYLVADALGHADVNTTRKHYAQMSEDNRRKAARAVKLRRE